jgi:hypothetical protein
VMWSRHIAEHPDYIAEKSIVNISPEVHHFQCYLFVVDRLGRIEVMLQ